MSSKILVVDDTPTVLDYLELVFSRQGFQVLRAGGGESAVRIAQRELPDVLLIDVMMPGMDGYEVCRLLRADPLTSRLPLLLYSAVVGHEARGRALASGADEFLGKEISHTELVDQVRDWMAARASPGGMGETSLVDVGLDLVELLQVELVWLLGVGAVGVGTLAVSSERGEQEARRFLQLVGNAGFSLGSGSVFGDAEAYGRIRVNQPVADLMSLTDGPRVTKAFNQLNAHLICTAPLDAPSGQRGFMMYPSTPTLASDRQSARTAWVGARYAALAIGTWGGLPVANGREPAAEVR